jgi:hypothetical protein
MNLLVIIAGAAGVGKTAVRHELYGRLRWPTFGPDDFPYRWNDIYPKMDRPGPCVIECCKVPRAVRERMATRESVVIELRAPEAVRRSRLAHQGLRAKVMADRLAEGEGDLGYQDPLEPDLQLDATGPPGEMVDQIVDFISSRYAAAI